MGRYINYIAQALLLLAPLVARGQDVPFVKVEARELPPLNTPRSANALLALEGGDILAIGGHTKGFIPVRTAEYFDGQEWHEIPMNYTHDGGFATILEDGSVLVGGGSAEAFGIGRSRGVEKYLPGERRFEPVGILDRPRAYASSISFPGDTVLITGNWYDEDALEVYVPGKGFRHQKTICQGRKRPFILKSAPNNAIIFCAESARGDTIPEPLADRWRGVPFSVPLLREWLPWPAQGNVPTAYGFIGNYIYLIPALRKADGQLGLLKIQGEQFSLLDTDAPVPMMTPGGFRINWNHTILVNRPARKAYLFGKGDPSQDLLLEIDYDPALDGGKARLVVHYADGAYSENPEVSLVLTPAGNVLIAGGRGPDNFHIHGESRLLLVGTPEVIAVDSKFSRRWLLIVAAVLLGMVLGLLLSKKPAPEPVQTPSQDLMSRILNLLENEEWFRRKDLTKAVLAQELGTNTTYITATVNSQGGKSFSELVASFRVAYAQKLMQEHPDMLLTVVGEESGFSTEKSFFRTFKAATGLTPTQWKQQNPS